jgi:hypothetical protein
VEVALGSRGIDLPARPGLAGADSPLLSGQAAPSTTGIMPLPLTRAVQAPPTEPSVSPSSRPPPVLTPRQDLRRNPPRNGKPARWRGDNDRSAGRSTKPPPRPSVAAIRIRSHASFRREPGQSSIQAPRQQQAVDVNSWARLQCPAPATAAPRGCALPGDELSGIGTAHTSRTGGSGTITGAGGSRP